VTKSTPLALAHLLVTIWLSCVKRRWCFHSSWGTICHVLLIQSSLGVRALFVM